LQIIYLQKSSGAATVAQALQENDFQSLLSARRSKGQRVQREPNFYCIHFPLMKIITLFDHFDQGLHGKLNG
jgi:hypothetical protein